jgi:hypothetical protein
MFSLLRCSSIGAVIGMLGCAADVGEPSMEGSELDDGVAVTAEALGSTQHVATLCNESTHRCATLGGSFTDEVALFVRSPIGTNGPDDIGMLNLSNGSLSWLPTPTGTTVVHPTYDPATRAIYYFDRNTSWIMVYSPIGPRRIGYAFSQPQGPLLIDSAYVYWDDSFGVHRSRKDGSTQTSSQTLLDGSNLVLLAMDGNELYVRRHTTSGFELRKVATDGSYSNFCYKQSDSFAMLSFDSTWFYWVGFVGTPASSFYIRKLNRSTCASASIVRQASNFIMWPRRRYPDLWWGEMETNGVDNVSYIMRRENSTNRIEHTVAGRLVNVHPGPTHMYWARYAGSPSSVVEKASY